MQKFHGFPPKTSRTVGLPIEVFTDLLPLIDDVAEMRLTLYTLWALQQKDGDMRYLRRGDFSGVTAVMHGLTEAEIDAALARALERETLLAAEVVIHGQAETLYFANSMMGRAALRQINTGRWRAGDAANPVEILPERPTIYRLYEENLGQLTPLIADDLKDLEQEYSTEWLAEAIQLSVESGKRSLRYVKGILKRWKEEGRSREISTGHTQNDGKRFVSGKFADFIEH